MTNEENKQEKVVKYTISETKNNLGYETQIEYPGKAAFGFPSRKEGPNIKVETINQHYVLEFFDHYTNYGNMFRRVFGVEDITTEKEKIKKLSLEELLDEIKERHKDRNSGNYEIIYDFNKNELGEGNGQ
jgi:hypothetical protein